MTITLKQLQYFLEIANQNSISAAAEKLNMSQPPLSAQLKMLEGELDTQLFERRKHRMVITEAGIKLRDRAEQILSLVDHTTQSIRNMNDSTGGTIRIGALTTACLQLLPEKAKQFLKIYPNVNFIIQETSTQRIGELVKNGIIDIGFIREPFNTDQFNSVRITNTYPEFLDDKMVAIGVPSFFKNIKSETIDFTQLSGIPLIIFGTYLELFSNISAKTKTELKIICRNDNLISQIGWAVNGIGVALLPRSSLTLMQLFKSNLIIKTIVNPYIPANILIITDKDISNSPIVERFIKFFI